MIWVDFRSCLLLVPILLIGAVSSVSSRSTGGKVWCTFPSHGNVGVDMYTARLGDVDTSLSLGNFEDTGPNQPILVPCYECGAVLKSKRAYILHCRFKHHYRCDAPRSIESRICSACGRDCSPNKRFRGPGGFI